MTLFCSVMKMAEFNDNADTSGSSSSAFEFVAFALFVLFLFFLFWGEPDVWDSLQAYFLSL